MSISAQCPAVFTEEDRLRLIELLRQMELPFFWEKLKARIQALMTAMVANCDWQMTLSDLHGDGLKSLSAQWRALLESNDDVQYDQASLMALADLVVEAKQLAEKIIPHLRHLLPADDLHAYIAASQVEMANGAAQMLSAALALSGAAGIANPSRRQRAMGHTIHHKPAGEYLPEAPLGELAKILYPELSQGAATNKLSAAIARAESEPSTTWQYLVPSPRAVRVHPDVIDGAKQWAIRERYGKKPASK